MTDYERYVNRFANEYGISVEEAEKRTVVKNVKKYYETGKCNESTVPCGWSEKEDKHENNYRGS